ncbi:hypothetical protein MHLP_02660 [Candidatus Mycoplasma haematolamae str. Purdue]|uniref:Uncharacterized protein n=1 Tax=Mycoplasma haematolamae (strain Purdue) TaxID=1212765 RepID=I7C6H2_MYCHA|nr:hypothetical protein [Candidatus Mycoplasma haematolamae]AFO52112.1 hypothetical protein MHLP_02660 [Candidatus Mycoplasma haematolamae str. Purdue]
MIGLGFAKLAGGSIVVAGVAGGGYAALNPSPLVEKSSKEVVFEVLSDQYVPGFQVICTSHNSKVALFDISLQTEYFKFKCDYKDPAEAKESLLKDLTVQGAKEQEKVRDKIVCKAQASNKYKCEYTDQHGQNNQKLKLIKTDFKEGETEANTKFLRPDI